MGHEPTTHCTECGDPFDVYRAPESRVCDDCAAENDADREMGLNGVTSTTSEPFGFK